MYGSLMEEELAGQEQIFEIVISAFLINLVQAGNHCSTSSRGNLPELEPQQSS